MALTDRQKEIKALLDKGQTPKQVGEALGISENAVYQQRRRIKAAGGTVKAAPATKKASASKPAKRQRAPRAQRPALAVVQPTTTGTATPRPADPLAEVQRRKAEIDALLSGAKGTLDEAATAHEAAQKAYAEAEGQVKPELEKLEAVEALLTGKLKPPKPAAKAKPAPAPPPAPPQPAPETHEAVAAAQDQAAEAPDVPTEVPAQGNGAGEERPGVPTVPEFAQEDAFAS